jgi:hypothetical protein
MSSSHIGHGGSLEETLRDREIASRPLVKIGSDCYFAKNSVFRSENHRGFVLDMTLKAEVTVDFGI